jgi:hypothetical protein
MKFVVVHTNCDCASGKTIRRNRSWNFGPRCPHCYRILGPMQYTIHEEIIAKNLDEAHRKWREIKDGQRKR